MTVSTRPYNVLPFNQPTPEWVEARRRLGITASEVGAAKMKNGSVDALLGCGCIVLILIANLALLVGTVLIVKWVWTW